MRAEMIRAAQANPRHTLSAVIIEAGNKTVKPYGSWNVKRLGVKRHVRGNR